ncbi:MAG TPA: PA domain-containing protein [Myxococcaceae bacterium]|nr:PA domain-containing protein [Myxococcaceae bacterium]
MKALRRFLGAALLLTAPAALANATIIITTGDASNTGFNDPTPRDPVGGNTGTTLGAQRLQVFLKAAEIWGQNLDSDVPITVFAQFTPLACTSSGATLGSAGPTAYFTSDNSPLDAGTPVFPKAQTWYVSAETSRFAKVQILPGTGSNPNNYDILARFNSALDTPQTANCNGFTWYYGLDNKHGSATDLLTVVLHEFGHGLGFLSLMNPGNGEFPALNEPDIWAHYVLDEASGKHWKDLTASQRAASVTSGALAWDGAGVTQAVPSLLGYPPVVQVTSAPNTPSVVKSYEFEQAVFGGNFPTDGGIAGPLGTGSTGWGCTSQGHLDPLTGKIAILDRGGPNDAGCPFVEKARNAQDAGAIALLVANNVDSAIFAPGISPTDDGRDIVIPVVMISQADGTSLKGAVTAGPVQGLLARDPSQGRAGADSSDRALLYAPTTFVSGSSVSHWDKSAFPNLLMEPVINQDLTHSLDLTPVLLRDIGWFPVDLAITGQGPSSLAAGQHGTFTFTVHNPGPYVAPAVRVSNTLTGLAFVSNSGDCTTAFPCVLGDLQSGETRTFTTVLQPGSSGDGHATTVATADSVSATSIANVSTLSVTVPSSSGGGVGGCTAALGPPAPWLALLGLVALARRRRS